MRLDEDTYARLQQRNVAARMQDPIRRSQASAIVEPGSTAGSSSGNGAGSAGVDAKRVDAAAHSEKSGLVILPYPISCNRYWRNFRGRMVVSSEAKAYKDQVAYILTRGFEFECLPLFTGDVAMTMKLHPKLTKMARQAARLLTLITASKCVSTRCRAFYTLTTIR